MRKQLMTTIYDEKAEIFSHFPHPASTENDAIRAFSDALTNPQSEFSKHPLDYSLYHIGTYDVITGEVKALQPIILIISGRDVIKTTTHQETELPFQSPIGKATPSGEEA